jgi:hypothetical protein
VEILIEKDVISPVGIVLEGWTPAEYWSFTIGSTDEYLDHSLG